MVLDIVGFFFVLVRLLLMKLSFDLVFKYILVGLLYTVNKVIVQQLVL